jgi:ankyrin repeat protein
MRKWNPRALAQSTSSGAHRASSLVAIACALAGLAALPLEGATLKAASYPTMGIVITCDQATASESARSIVARNLRGALGIEENASPDPAKDLVVKVSIKCEALNAVYGGSNGAAFTAYSGARVSGDIGLFLRGKRRYKESFAGARTPPSKVSEAFSTPASAPFALALEASNLGVRVVAMLSETFGDESCAGYLASKFKDEDPQVRSQAVLALVNAVDALSWSNDAGLPAYKTAGIDANAQDKDGYTALSLLLRRDWSDDAFLKQHPAELLLALGARPDIAAKDGSTPLYWAIVNAHSVTLAKLIAMKPDLNAALPDGTTLLMRVAQIEFDYIDGAKLLVENGAALETRDAQGRTALHYAAMNHLPKCVNYLLGKGAAVDAPDKSGYTPLLLAVGPPPKSSYSTSDYQREVIALLLAKGANLNAVDSDGNTLLMRAIAFRNETDIKALLAAKPDMALRNKAGQTAMDFAKAYGDFGLLSQ